MMQGVLWLTFVLRWLANVRRGASILIL